MVSDDSSSYGTSSFENTLDFSAGTLGGHGARRPGHPPAKRNLKSRRSTSDQVFRTIARTGGSVALIVMILIGVFLTSNAWPALRKAGWSFFTTQTWNPEGGAFGIAAVIVGTCLIALVAIVVGVPLAIGTALYISEYAPKSIQRLLVSMLDLMAAVPSVIFGLWGAYLFEGKILPTLRWLSDWFYWFPPFQVSNVDRSNPLTPLTVYSASTVIAGIVVGLMITPIAGSVMREAFGQAPVSEREGAYALGATRWGMVRSVVLPFGRGAMVGGAMLGLGRALGETVAVFYIISIVYTIQPHVLQHGGSSVAALIVSQFSEVNPFGVSALMAAGLTLFAMTLLVNFVAARIVARSRSGAQSEA